jgi:hypothetical protein
MRTRSIVFLAFCVADRGVNKVATTASGATAIVSVNKHTVVCVGAECGPDTNQ